MENVNEAQEAFNNVNEMSKLLNTGLDRETLAILMRLCEKGIDPEALAAVVKELTQMKAKYDSKKSNRS